MSPRTTYLSKLIGISLMLYAIFMVTNRELLTVALTALREPSQIFIWGTILLFSGVAYILAHNRWSGGVLTVVVTIIGWMTLLKGLVLLYLPASTQISYVAFYESFYYGYAAIALALGAWLTYEGWKSSSAAGKGAEIAP